MMRGSYNIIIYKPAEIVYVLTPKCGSTTMMNAFMTMAGIESRGVAIRKEKGEARSQGRLTEKGLRIERCTQETVIATRRRYPSYMLMANIRCPYERIVSNYYNKLNRYTLPFARKIYFFGKFRQFLDGPGSWRSVERGNHFMQRQLSFEEMLRGLEVHGTGFDVHYAPQSELLLMDRIPYDRLIRLEQLESELVSAMEECGIAPEALRRIRSLPRSNATVSSDDREALMTPHARGMIARLYAVDFEKLGYS